MLRRSFERATRCRSGHLGPYGAAMTESDFREPPFAGTEVEHLHDLPVGRPTASAAGLQTLIKVNVGGLLKHLAFEDDIYDAFQRQRRKTTKEWDSEN